MSIRLSTLLDELPEVRLVHGPADLLVGGIEEDSRRVLNGDLFVAVPGTRHDGVQFVPQALRSGAVAIALEPNAGVQLPDRIARLDVPDARAATSLLAAAFRRHPERAVTPIGVTGTNGKTTTATLIRHILSESGEPAGMLGTTGYYLGGEERPSVETTPGGSRLIHYLSVMRDAGMRFCAMEVSSHALDQRRTAALAFKVGVLTNITADHLTYHGGMGAYRRAKRRLFESLAPDAWAVLNASDPGNGQLMADATAARVLWYGTEKGDVRARILKMNGRHTLFNLIFPDGGVTVRMPLLGRFNVDNALAAAAACWAVGVPGPSIAGALETVRGVPGRLEPVDAGQPFPVLIDYAHTEDALDAVLRALRPLVDGKLIVVFGAGGNRDRDKRPRMGAVVRSWADVSVVTSDNPRSENPASIIEQIASAFGPGDRFECHVDRAAGIRAGLAHAVAPEDMVLIAGKGHEDYQEFAGGQRVPFVDGALARQLLRQRYLESTGARRSTPVTPAGRSRTPSEAISDPPPSPVMHPINGSPSGRLSFYSPVRTSQSPSTDASDRDERPAR